MNDEKIAVNRDYKLTITGELKGVEYKEGTTPEDIEYFWKYELAEQLSKAVTVFLPKGLKAVVTPIAKECEPYDD